MGFWNSLVGSFTFLDCSFPASLVMSNLFYLFVIKRKIIRNGMKRHVELLIQRCEEDIGCAQRTCKMKDWFMCTRVDQDLFMMRWELDESGTKWAG